MGEQISDYIYPSPFFRTKQIKLKFIVLFHQSSFFKIPLLQNCKYSKVSVWLILELSSHEWNHCLAGQPARERSLNKHSHDTLSPATAWAKVISNGKECQMSTKKHVFGHTTLLDEGLFILIIINIYSWLLININRK